MGRAFAEQKRQLEREASGEAAGMRYAIECGSCWVDADGKHHLEPVFFVGDREYSQVRAGPAPREEQPRRFVSQSVHLHR